MIIFFLQLTRGVKSSISAAVQSLGYGSVLFLCSRTLLSFVAGAQKALPAACAQALQQRALRVIPANDLTMLQSVISCYSCSAAGNAAFKGYSQNLHFFLLIDTTNILKEQLVICSFLTFCYLPPGKCTNISMQIPAQSLLLLNTNYNL